MVIMCSCPAIQKYKILGGNTNAKTLSSIWAEMSDTSLSMVEVRWVWSASSWRSNNRIVGESYILCASDCGWRSGPTVWIIDELPPSIPRLYPAGQRPGLTPLWKEVYSYLTLAQHPNPLADIGLCFYVYLAFNLKARCSSRCPYYQDGIINCCHPVETIPILN